MRALRVIRRDAPIVAPLMAAVFALTAALPAQAENPFMPGDFAVPFRSLTGGEIVHDETGGGRITAREGAEVTDTVPEGYEDTCWIVHSSDAHSVTMTLLTGTFRPAWEGGKAYEEWTDTWRVDALAPFPTDMDAKEFSLFRQVKSCL